MLRTNNLEDHRLIQYQAGEIGLTYREFREKLRAHKIDIETAIENARYNITIHEHLAKRRKEKEYEEINKRFSLLNIILYGVLAAILYSEFSQIKIYEETKNNLESKLYINNDLP